MPWPRLLIAPRLASRVCGATSRLHDERYRCFIAEEMFDPCLPRAYRRKGCLSVEAAAAAVLSQAAKHQATGAVLYHLARRGTMPWGECHKLTGHLRREAEPRGLRLLDYLVISPPYFESLRRSQSWEKP